jgi:hypothetical protein
MTPLEIELTERLKQRDLLIQSLLSEIAMLREKTEVMSNHPFAQGTSRSYHTSSIRSHNASLEATHRATEYAKQAAESAANLKKSRSPRGLSFTHRLGSPTVSSPASPHRMREVINNSGMSRISPIKHMFPSSPPQTAVPSTDESLVEPVPIETKAMDLASIRENISSLRELISNSMTK